MSDIPSGWADSGMYTTEDRVRVKTTIDGEVVDFTVESKGGLEHPWYSPYDLYTAGKILVSLAKLGIIFVKSLMRKATIKRAARKLLKGPTEELAKDASKVVNDETKQAVDRVISGNPPVVNIGATGRPGNLVARVDIGHDGEVIYNVQHIVLKPGEDATAAELASLTKARLAHRTMITRAAEEARRRGLKEFIFRGEQAGPAFVKHANDLAREIGVPGTGHMIGGSGGMYGNYEVTLNVAKVLASQ